ncbi:MAG: hypothetical protein ACLSX5_12350 [Lachnospiraceae bacterium]
MSLKESLKAEVKEEKAKLKNMSFRDKLWYIWEYYKIHMVIGCVILFFLYAIGTIFYQKSFTTQLYCVVMNDRSVSGADYEKLAADFKTRMGYGEKDKVEMDTSLYISFGENTSQMDYASLAKVTAIIASKDLDVMIADSAAIDHYAVNGGFFNLEETLPADLWELVKDDVYMAKDEAGNFFPAAINLEHSQFHKKAGTQMEEAYFSLIGNSTRTDTAIQFLRYLYE